MPDYNKEFEEYYKIRRRKKKKKDDNGPCAISALIGLSLLATGAGELFTGGVYV